MAQRREKLVYDEAKQNAVKKNIQEPKKNFRNGQKWKTQ